MKNWDLIMTNWEIDRQNRQKKDHQKCGCHWLSTRSLMIDQINTKNCKLPSGNQTWLVGKQHVQHVGRKIVQ